MWERSGENGIPEASREDVGAGGGSVGGGGSVVDWVQWYRDQHEA